MGRQIPLAYKLKQNDALSETLLNVTVTFVCTYLLFYPWSLLLNVLNVKITDVKNCYFMIVENMMLLKMKYVF